jgi:predicted GNAT superfamily acetyltransferase
MNIRQLTTIPEFEQCLELQREGFGWSDADLMPVRFFIVTHHIGGLVLGAYEGDKLVGFLSSIPGIRDDFFYWHSHMLVVSQIYRNKGVGSRLKFSQREYAIKRGIRLIEWTFDPLEARNAYFNFQKLGVIVRRYHPNLYGEATGMQGGLPTDRIVAEWWLDRTRAPISGGERRVRIHPDIQMLKRLDIHSARSLQLRVAQEFKKNLDEQFQAVAFLQTPESSEYVFVRGASGVYSTG